MEIGVLSKDIAVEFIQRYHYSKILPRLTKLYLGFFEEDELVGVVTLGWGTQPLQTIRKLFHKHDFVTADYYEIGKMCFLPRMNESNFGSSAMRQLIRWVKENTNVKYIYTLADGIMGKCGYVYQASNFVYLGSFKTDVYMDLQTGEKMHPRSIKSLHVENAQMLGKKKVFWLTPEFCEMKGIDRIRGLMFRYIFPLDKRSRKVLNSYLEYRGLQYPKNGDLKFFRRVGRGKYEEIDQPEFNMNVFNHNFQKYGNDSVAKDLFFPR